MRANGFVDNLSGEELLGESVIREKRKIGEEGLRFIQIVEIAILLLVLGDDVLRQCGSRNT
ncbi:hypothetical protein FRX31_021559 [Thalictrum thalictroides]|uniref:Uncharacterized protein n=1 Tax=Thalictrum thalictroides TaxID=46969 RepID=A0A7J6VUS6_THATH|nr:hypothetical protein FRX31_021559 [Thalictrum thalictroides]